MNSQSAISFDDLMAKLNRDPEFRKAGRKIRPYYDLVTQIIHRRNDLNLTQKDLADRLGTHQSRISKIESAEHDLRLSTLIEIAEALETEILIQMIPADIGYVPVGVSQASYSSDATPVEFTVTI